MGKILITALLLIVVCCVRPPAPTCRPSNIPSMIPVSIGETVRLDLQNIFDGYNLTFEGVQKDHIKVQNKYQVNSTDFPHSFNFTMAKIKDHNRFLGLATHDQFTQLTIGTNHQESGVVVERVIQVQDIPQLHCFDVDQIFDSVNNKTYAIIDCGLMRMGELRRNQFLFVDLSSYQVVQGSRVSDVYVNYNHIVKRNIQIMTDPFSHIQYILRFYTAENVDGAHSDQTYVQIMIHTGTIMQIQIFDVIDHTLLNLPTLAIMDYQIHMNFIYLLVRDTGVYQIQFSSSQRLIRTSYFPIKMNINRFRIEQNGFNDDLHVVLSNDNTIYQYQWDVLAHPVLVTKYTLMGGSKVEQILMDEQFVIVQAWAVVDTELQRRTWIFSRRTQSYTNAFGSFHEPSYGPSIIIYHPWERTLHLIHEYRSYNIRLNIPYLYNRPISGQKAGESESYVVKATSSTGENGTKIECRQTLNFIYIENTDQSIFKTGLQQRSKMYVDAPDDISIDLQYQFFGRNISYDVSFSLDNATNSTAVPEYYIQKKVKAQLNFPPEIDQSKIVYFQIFAEDSLIEVEDKNNIYGIVQVQQTSSSFPIYYIHCAVQIDAQFVNPVLKCRTVTKSNLSRGKILHMSQMFSTKQRIGAIVFSNQDTVVLLYNFYPNGFMYYGQIGFGYSYENQMTGLQVTMKKQLIITFQYSKRLQVYNVEDIHHMQQKPAKPLMTIDHRVISFFGIDYFAPTQTKVSIYHDQVLFVKSKNGVMALNINQAGFPQLLFHVKTSTSLYDFEINRDTLVILTQTQMSMYRLTRPLRRIHQPFLLQKFQADFNLNEYDDINSDGLFYLVQKQDTMLLVVHPNMPSTSVIYTQIYVGKILMIDAVRLNDKQVVLMWTGTSMVAYLFAQNPKLKIKWQPNQSNFTYNITAHNQAKKPSEPYITKVQVIQSNQAYINATQKFNQTQIRKLGHVETNKNSKVDINITLNDTEWFVGNVMHYTVECKDCNKNVTDDKQFNIVLQNHIGKLNTDIRVGEPVYDLHSTFMGIYGQQFNSIFRTFQHNDSVQHLTKLPTSSMGQACTKMAVHGGQDFVLSLCESGGTVGVYITVTGGFKPFTYGPFQTDAQAVNHVQLVGNILMIVDNDDDPFNRPGGVYLYYIDFSARDPEDMFNMLDYLDYADMQLQGFTGAPHVASADIHKPLFNKDQYVVLITQARTGNIFIFLFQVSANKQQAVYLQRRMLNLNNLLPPAAKHPMPIRVINVNILDYTVKNFYNEDGSPSARMQIQYVILLTVRNWHHIELMIVFDAEYDLMQFQLTRIYERVPYPWELTNFIRLRKGSLNASYFAVSYRNYEAGSQVMVVYELPYFRISQLSQSQKLQAHLQQQLQDGIPKTRMLGAYRVLDTSQICFAFNTRDQHRILFNDASSKTLQQLQLNKQLKLVIKNADPSIIEAQNITITAHNHYSNFSFIVEMSLIYNPDDDNKLKVQIIWIIILVIGFFMIIGLIFVWSRQSKTQQKDSVARQSKQSLLTVQPEFKGNYINRSSADPESIRGTVEYVQPTPVTAPVPTKTMKKQTEPEQPLKQTNPLEERLVDPAEAEEKSNL